MSGYTPEQVLTDLAAILGNFNGREYSGTIGPETLFFGDLGMVSIDAVVLGETLEKHYGQRFPFSRFLAELAQRGARDIALGELVAFIHGNLQVQQGRS